MKVRINQATDIDKIPEALSDLFESLVTDSSAMTTQAGDIADISRMKTDSTLKYRLALDMLSEIRLKMVDMNQTIVDLLSIVEGYADMLESQREPASKAPPAPVPAPAVHSEAPKAPPKAPPEEPPERVSRDLSDLLES